MHDIEAVKNDRCQMHKEIARLNDYQGQLCMCAHQMAEKLKCLNCEISKMASRVEDLTRIIEMKTNDLRAKHQALSDCQCELARVRHCVE